MMRRFLRRLLWLCVGGGVACIIGLLMAELNHRHYRLRASHHELFVERGLFLPMGFGRHAWQPPADGGAGQTFDVYAPLPLPPGETFSQSATLDDRTELDRALFDLLYGWAKPRLASATPSEQQLAVRYVSRLQALPSLSEAQRLQLRQLRADVAFIHARQVLAGVASQLIAAQDDLRQAINMGSARHSEAAALLEQLDAQLQQLPPAAAKQPPTP